MKRMAEVQAAETKAGSSEERLTELPLPPEKLEPRARPHLSASKRSPVLRNAAGLDTEPSWLTFPVQVQAFLQWVRLVFAEEKEATVVSHEIPRNYRRTEGSRSKEVRAS